MSPYTYSLRTTWLTLSGVKEATQLYTSTKQYYTSTMLHYTPAKIFSSRTLVAKALKVLIMLVSHPLEFFLPIFFIFQNIIFQVIPSNPVKLFF